MSRATWRHPGKNISSLSKCYLGRAQCILRTMAQRLKVKLQRDSRTCVFTPSHLESIPGLLTGHAVHVKSTEKRRLGSRGFLDCSIASVYKPGLADMRVLAGTPLDHRKELTGPGCRSMDSTVMPVWQATDRRGAAQGPSSSG